jgi:hypothetical protein
LFAFLLDISPPLIIDYFFSSPCRESYDPFGGEKLVVPFFVGDLESVTFLWKFSDPLGDYASFFPVSVGYRLTIADLSFKVP